VTSENLSQVEWVGKVLWEAIRYYDLLFYSAPIMLHSTDREGRLIKVSDRWLRRLGYQKDEVLGRKSVDFLTEDFRDTAIKKCLPNFWRSGDARDIDYQFMAKNGEVVNVLLDAEVSHGIGGELITLAALRDEQGPPQDRQALHTIRALQHLSRLRRELEGIEIVITGDHKKLTDDDLAFYSTHLRSKGPSVEQPMGTLVDIFHDISVYLRGLLKTQEEVLSEGMERQREMLDVIKNIDRTLVELVDAVAIRNQKIDSPDDQLDEEL